MLLPETHPPERRVAVDPRQLAATNLAILRNRQFLRLGLAGGFNFAAIFVYIASAPAFVLEILRLNAQQFGWFFVPMIGGMSLGAFLSSHLAGRLRAERTAALGFALCAVAVVGNLGYSLIVGDQAHTLWAVLPVSLNAMGVAIAFPILMMAILDMYPRQRGGASSMQMVLGLSVNTLVAGALSPWASQSPLRLAACSLVLAGIAWLLWRSYLQRAPGCKGPREAEEVLALEPTDRL
jgi:DHA1 family bicyclomycin/chloramphenicol resistance-like MFS transporter